MFVLLNRICLFTLLLGYISTALLTQGTSSPYSCPYCDLAGKDFSNQDLTDANFVGANLKNANFSNATILGAQFLRAQLQGADFKGAKIGSSSKYETNFSFADLTRSSFVKVRFSEANFQFADISGSDFSYTDLRNIKFGVDLKYDQKNVARPKFNNCQIDCQFPAHWPYLDLEGTPLPDCRNNLNLVKKDKPSFLLSEVYTATEQPFPARRDSIWVSKTGTNVNTCGSYDSPCASIALGVSRCSNNCVVLVEAAEFTEPTTVGLRTGVYIQGGYHEGQPTVFKTAIKGLASGQPNFFGYELSNSGISGFLFSGADATTGTVSTSCLRFTNSYGVKLYDLIVAPGKGSDGRPGKDGHVGRDGVPGHLPTKNGKNLIGGLGGTNPECPCSNTGGKGANVMSNNNYYEPKTVTPGLDGNCPSGVAKAAPLSNGHFSSSIVSSWIPPAIGNDGQAGQSGTPGGGGNGYKQYLMTGMHLYSAGGGGGSGGCGGTQALAGGVGGASFGMILDNSGIEVIGNRVVFISTKGGNGGKGGDGAPGGAAGKGGAPPPYPYSPAKGKDFSGAPGGRGSASSGAAGGNGGPSAGVALIGIGRFIAGAPIIYLGLGGDGGKMGMGGAKGNGACNAIDGAPGIAGNAQKTMKF